MPARVPPMLWASLLGRPRLLLPEELWARFDAAQQAAVLAHELAHWKRSDHWVRRLEAVVLGLYWWCPVAWWASRRLEQAEEECCDAWVVWSLPSAAGSYAEALVATAAFLSGYRNSLPVGASGAGAYFTAETETEHDSARQAGRVGGAHRSESYFHARRFHPALLAFSRPWPAGGRQSAPIAPAVQPPRSQTTTIAPPSKISQKKAADELESKEIALDPNKPTVKVRVVRPVVREVSDYVIVRGRLEAAHSVELRPRASGMIVNVHCRPGQVVTANDELFQIDDRSCRIECEKAEAEVRRAEARLKRCRSQFAPERTAEESDDRPGGD